jgi:2-iminobutanoate/2-iminopropanoate deaminase
MILRSNPAVGYLDEEVFTANAFTQTIRAGNTLYLSGIAPLKGGFKDLEVVGAGNLRAQVEWTLEVMKRCLAAEGATFRNLVAQTVYTTNMAELVKLADLFRSVYGNYAPTSTWVEIRGLFHPQQMVEINGIAVLE